jgi:CRP/FNR family transcriptional regulator, cyclic AMP receptor protein
MRKALYILGVLEDSDIDWMVSAGRRERVAAGSTLIREARDIEALYIILDGTFAVRTSAAAGKDVAILKAGEIVGEMSFVDSRPPSADVIAIEDSMVLSIPRTVLSERFKEPGFASRFYRALAIFLASRLRKTVAQLGYGRIPAKADTIEDEEEVGPMALENLVVAGARFDWMLKRLRGE